MTSPASSVGAAVGSLLQGDWGKNVDSRLVVTAQCQEGLRTGRWLQVFSPLGKMSPKGEKRDFPGGPHG